MGLSALGGLGMVYGHLGNFARKRDFLERMLPIMEREFGADHCNVAVTLAELASTCGELGDSQCQGELLDRSRCIEECGAFCRFYGDSDGQKSDKDSEEHQSCHWLRCCPGRCKIEMYLEEHQPRHWLRCGAGRLLATLAAIGCCRRRSVAGGPTVETGAL